ncbi:MAG: hypothetical protein K6C97_10665 [Treponema sp.]|nr:hypothetical protein [Treponema sp.]
MNKQSQLDEDLRNLLIEKSRSGYAIISVYNPDREIKHRNNGKKSKSLKNKIIEAGFAFKKLSTKLSNGDLRSDFIVFAEIDKVGCQEKDLQDFLQTCQKSYKHFSIQYDIENYLKDYLRDNHFYHPLIKSEKKLYLQSREVILTDLFEPPESINGWTIRKAFSETSFLYERGSFLCGIHEKENGQWERVYGTIRPVGVTIKKEFLKTRDEALKNLSISKYISK